jgi:hypothetical protein
LNEKSLRNEKGSERAKKKKRNDHAAEEKDTWIVT